MNTIKSKTNAINAVNIVNTTTAFSYYCPLQNKLVSATKKGCNQVTHDKCTFLQYYLDTHKPNNIKQTTITVTDKRNNVETIIIEDIINLKGKAHYTGFNFTNKYKKTYSGDLKHFEDLLSFNNNFVRSHRSNIINLLFVNRTTPIIDGKILMLDGTLVAISEPYKKDISAIIKSWNIPPYHNKSTILNQSLSLYFIGILAISLLYCLLKLYTH